MAHKMKLSFSKTKLSQSKNRGYIPTKAIASKDHMAKEHLIANSKLKNLGGRSIFFKVKT